MALMEITLIPMGTGTTSCSPYIARVLDIAEKVPQDIKEIELVGIVTNICVISNAVTFQSQFVDAEIIVDASLTAGFDEEMHKKSLEVMESFQVKVINK